MEKYNKNQKKLYMMALILIILITCFISITLSYNNPAPILFEDKISVKDSINMEEIKPVENKEPVKEETKLVENKEPIKEETKPIENKEPIKEETKPVENKEPVKEETKPVENKEPVKEEIKPVENKEPEISLGIINFLYNNGTMVPDKYNSGYNQNIRLKKFSFDSFPLRISSSTMYNGKVNLPAAIINMSWPQNEDLNGRIVIENYDFSDYVLRFYNSENRNTDITIVFKNSKFKTVMTPPDFNDHIKLIFENCEFNNFYGSNANIVNSKFIIQAGDGINPFKNINVSNCYFMKSDDSFSDNEVHIDGVQIYAHATTEANNIHFNNTRMELPYILSSGNSKSYVNAPIMLQLEYNNGNNISFENMYINGGGYSIYSHAIKGYTYNNVSFKNIYVGGGRLYGILYPDVTINGYTSNNVVDNQSLLITSVWKDDNGVHIVTTNDTLSDRKMICKTDRGDYSFSVSGHPKLTKEIATKYKFNDLPYDIDFTIKDKKITWIKCYDITYNSILIKSFNF